MDRQTDCSGVVVEIPEGPGIVPQAQHPRLLPRGKVSEVGKDRNQELPHGEGLEADLGRDANQCKALPRHPGRYIDAECGSTGRARPSAEDTDAPLSEGDTSHRSGKLTRPGTPGWGIPASVKNRTVPAINTLAGTLPAPAVRPLGERALKPTARASEGSDDE